ncbi:MAG: DUF551 domain-containing protein [Clostridiales bacterium]|nr:DUF551 domain-containing protein [Clostridiales bacterium]
MTDWISVKDRLPEVGKNVIICRPDVPGKYIVEQGYLRSNGWWKVYGTNVKRVTYWMPLPEPPEVGR